MRLAILLLMICCVASGGPLSAQQQDEFVTSEDVVDAGGHRTKPGEIARHSLGTYVGSNFSLVPGSGNNADNIVDGLHDLGGGQWLFSLQPNVVFNPSPSADPRDVIRYDGVGFDLFFCGTMVTDPVEDEECNLDALYLDDAGNLVVSFDNGNCAGTYLHGPSDLVRYIPTGGGGCEAWQVDNAVNVYPTNPHLVFDSSEEGVPPGGDIVGAAKTATGIALAFDAPVALPTNPPTDPPTQFPPGQLVHWNGPGATFSLHRVLANWPTNAPVTALSLPATCSAIDVDMDTFTQCSGDCDDADPNVNPGQVEIGCDAVDNDCDGGTPDVLDGDMDMFTCDLDCDDVNPATYPGAETEVNDGVDNQCPGNGQIDELTGTPVFDNPVCLEEYSWPVQAGAMTYQFARSNQPDFSHTDLVTLIPMSADPCSGDGDLPAVGETFYYLARPVDPFAGSWGATERKINFVTNGDMETWANPTTLTGWDGLTSGGRLDQDTVESFENLSAARLTREQGGTVRLQKRQISLQPGIDYRLSLEAKFSETAVNPLYVRVFHFASGLDMTVDFVNLSTSYETITIFFTVPDDLGFLPTDEYRLVLGHGATPINSELWIDDLQIQPAVNRLPDGDLEAWSSPVDLAGWDELIGGGRVDQDTVEPFEQFSAARLTREQGGAVRLQRRQISLLPGLNYQLSLAAKYSDVTTSSLYVRVFHFATGTNVKVQFLNLSASYQTILVPFTVPDNLGFLPTDEYRLVIGHGATPVGSELWMDDLRIDE